jgi:(2Fe-2S) ferredoxin
MKQPNHHIFVCASFRVTGSPQGACNKKGSVQLLQYLEEGISDRGIENVAVSTTGCLKYCEQGPVMVVYPENKWYGEVNEAKIDEALDEMAK